MNEAPKILAIPTDDGSNVKIDDMLCGRTITISKEQAEELWKALDLMFNDYYKQEPSYPTEGK